ncbi:hypothetical protein CEXT_145321 [Caerostris extrusa]|uniref:Uncharacterized protein n=1 Tax=Caerostris extrusa TaxID=172846 RepID=A0AAV4PVZ8_CAEEX|nr:hypothetical protein CEXT_145321 [Caerostris extrusa]
MRLNAASSAKDMDTPACNVPTGNAAGSVPNTTTQGSALQRQKDVLIAAPSTKLQRKSTTQNIGHLTTSVTYTKKGFTA